MRKSKTLAKWRANKTARIAVLGHLFPAFIRYAAHHHFDCVWLDLEHRAMDQREIQTLMAFCHLYDIDCLLRAPTLEKSGLARYLEDGATGLLIPHVSTPEKAQELVVAAKFPPLGDRGIDAAGLDCDFSLPDGPTYADEANRETFLVVQIETPLAVHNVEAIAALEGIDALFLGPGDLNLRLKTDKNKSMTMEDAQLRVAAAAEKFGKPWGQPVGSIEDLQALHEKGARMLIRGSEFLGMIVALETAARELDTVCKE